MLIITKSAVLSIVFLYFLLVEDFYPPPKFFWRITRQAKYVSNSAKAGIYRYHGLARGASFRYVFQAKKGEIRLVFAQLPGEHLHGLGVSAGDYDFIAFKLAF